MDRTTRAILLTALALAALFSAIGLDAPLWGSEGRFAVVAREMGETGDLLRMTIGGVPYPDKPHGSYWLILAVSSLAGGVTEVTARLPGVLAFVLTVWVTFLLGRRSIGDRPAALAALLLATSLRIVYWSRAASADPQSMLGTTLALWLLLVASERGRAWHLPVFGFVVAASALLKGMSGLAVPAFVGGLWLVLVRGFAWIRPIPALAGVLVLVSTLAAPFLGSGLLHGDWSALDLFWRESVTRAFDPFDHVEPPWYYLWRQFDLFAPWALFLPAALVSAFAAVRDRAREHGRPGLRMFDTEERRRAVFPLFCFLAIFLLFTLSRSRRSYYLMPAAPFLALIVARMLTTTTGTVTRTLERTAFALVGAIGILTGAALLAAGIAGLVYDSPPAWLPRADRIPPGGWQAIPGWLPLLGAAVVPGFLVLRRLARRPVVPAVLLAAVATFALVSLRAGMRGATDRLPDFCERVRETVPADAALAREEGGDAKLVFYLHRPSFTLESRPPETRWLILEGEEAEALRTREPAAWDVEARQWKNAAPGSREAEDGYVLLKAR